MNSQITEKKNSISTK
jgi:hypothetical protein